MKKYTYLILALFISVTSFAQKPLNKQKKEEIPLKTKFFIDDREADHLVATLLDPKNYLSIGISGISPADMTKKTLANKQRTLRVALDSKAKYMNLYEFFERYKVPMANQQTIKVNGELLTIRENFLANENRIGNVELNKDSMGNAYVNIISKVPDYAKNPN